MKRIIDDLLDISMRNEDLERCREKLAAIKKIMFDKPTLCFKTHHKLIFPISVKDGSQKIPFNFAYTNYKEKREFKNKVSKTIRLFRDRYNADVFLDCVSFFLSADIARKVFGVLWLPGKKVPRFKFHFCELQEISLKKRFDLIKDINRRIFQDNFHGVLDPLDFLNLSLIGIDFDNNTQYELKLYYLYKKSNFCNHFIDTRLKSSVFIRRLNKKLNAEGDRFMIMLRFNRDSKLLSIKYYRIFERWETDSDIDWILSSAKKIIKEGQFEKMQKYLNQYITLASKYNLGIKLSLLGIDLLVNKNTLEDSLDKSDLYISLFRKNISEGRINF